MDYHCPLCADQLSENSGLLHCEHCRKNFILQACCPTCHKPLDVLKACGAVDYFCSRGHGLISKKSVELSPAELTSSH